MTRPCLKNKQTKNPKKCYESGVTKTTRYWYKDNKAEEDTEINNSHTYYSQMISTQLIRAHSVESKLSLSGTGKTPGVKR